MSKRASELDRLEERILILKEELSRFSRERWQAARGDERQNLQARTKIAEKTLENCDWLAKYVANFSLPIATRLETEDSRVRSEMERVKRLNNAAAFHEWVRTSLVPVVKFSEQTAYVAAASFRRAQQGQAPQYKWTRRR